MVGTGVRALVILFITLMGSPGNMALADLLEEFSNQRMSKLPGMDAVNLAGISAPVQPFNTPTETTGGIESLLPLIGRDRPGGAGQGAMGPAGDIQQLARQMAMNKWDYTRPDWQKFKYIVEHESNWQPHALGSVVNGQQAAGIPQRMMDLGDARDWAYGTPPRGQLNWMLSYINNRYGGIDNAYAHKQDTGWY